MSIGIRILGAGDHEILGKVAGGVFDHPIDQDAAVAVLNDRRHHLIVALDADLVVGMLSAVDYIHPDKPVPELWINEVGVANSHRRRGIGKRMLDAALDHARTLGCSNVWVLTETSNAPAMRLYLSAGGVSTDQIMISFSLD